MENYDNFANIPWSQPAFPMPCGTYEPHQFIQGMKTTLPMTPRRFFYQNGWWYCEERSRRIVQIAAISVVSYYVINPRVDFTFSHIVAMFQEGNMYRIAKISEKDFAHRRVVSCFEGIKKDVDCPNELLNELLFYLLQTCQQGCFLTIPEVPGWNITQSGRAFFITGNGINPFLEEFYPDCVKHRKLPVCNQFQGDLFPKLMEKVLVHWKIRLLFALRILSLLLSIYAGKGKNLQQFFVLEPSNTICAETLIVQRH